MELKEERTKRSLILKNMSLKSQQDRHVNTANGWNKKAISWLTDFTSATIQKNFKWLKYVNPDNYTKKYK